MKFYKRHMKRPILLLTLCLVCVALGGCSDQQVRDALIDMGYMPGPTKEPTQEPALLATLPPLELEAHLFAGETETPGPQQATPEPSPTPEGETSQPEPVSTPEPGAETPAPSTTPESGQDTGGAGFEGEEAEPASAPEGEASSGEASGQAVESAGAASEEPSLDTDARLDAPSQSDSSEAE